MSKRLSKFPRTLIILGIGFGFMAIMSKITGVPLFHEFRDQARRVVERTLPVEPVGARAKRQLDAKLQNANLSLGREVFVRIFKQEAQMEMWVRDGQTYRLLHSYPICKHSGFLGPKLREGDKQAPEGFYAVTKKQLNPGSRHYRAFNIGFPNEYDRAYGRTGSALMVHGGCTSIGCYAMTDVGVGEIYRLVEKALAGGQRRVPVHIFPFRMTKANRAQYPTTKWNAFWDNLQQGYDLFEQTKIPPKASACGKRYVFETKASCRLIAGW